MSFAVLPYFSPVAVIAEASQKAHEPCRDIIATFAHECNFLICDPEILQHANLLHDEFSESGWIHRVVAVIELIFDLSARETFYYRTTHRELIQVIIGKMLYYLSHDKFFFSIIPNNASPPSMDGE